eukprot:COSAG02_NODE_26910_length_621_cov_1.065134_2_plen_49_part_01
MPGRLSHEAQSPDSGAECGANAQRPPQRRREGGGEAGSAARGKGEAVPQ